MIFARKVWHLLVAIKDGLVLLFMLLFFFALYAALTVRPGVAQLRDGALLLKLDFMQRIARGEDAEAERVEGCRRGTVARLSLGEH